MPETRWQRARRRIAQWFAGEPIMFADGRLARQSRRSYDSAGQGYREAGWVTRSTDANVEV